MVELFDAFGPYLLSYWDLDSAEGGWGPGPGGEAESATSQGGIACHPRSERLHWVPVRRTGSVHWAGQVTGSGGGLAAEQMPVWGVQGEACWEASRWAIPSGLSGCHRI